MFLDFTSIASAIAIFLLCSSSHIYPVIFLKGKFFKVQLCVKEYTS